MNTLKNIIEEGRLLMNRIRIIFLRIFTDRVKVVDYKDENGNTHRITAEQRQEKVCAHTRIEQIYGTFWHCMDCPDVFFEITYKVALNRLDLFGFLEAMAKYLKTESPLNDDEDDTDSQQ